MRSLNSIQQDPVKTHPKIFGKRIDGGGEWFIAECRRGHGEGMRQRGAMSMPRRSVFAARGLRDTNDSREGSGLGFWQTEPKLTQ
jgi:hypothetical protein